MAAAPTLVAAASSAAKDSVQRALLDLILPLQQQTAASASDAAATIEACVKPLSLPAPPLKAGARVKTPMGNGRVVSFRELSVEEAGTVPMGGCYEVELIQDGGCAIAKGLAPKVSGKSKGSKKRGRSPSAAEVAETAAKAAAEEKKIVGWARGFFARDEITLREGPRAAVAPSKSDAFVAAAHSVLAGAVKAQASVQAAHKLAAGDDSDSRAQKKQLHCASGAGCTPAYDVIYGNDTALCVVHLHQVRVASVACAARRLGRAPWPRPPAAPPRRSCAFCASLTPPSVRLPPGLLPRSSTPLPQSLFKRIRRARELSHARQSSSGVKSLAGASESGDSRGGSPRESAMIESELGEEGFNRWLRRLLQLAVGEIKSEEFEQASRELLGASAFVVFTMERLLQQLMFHILVLVGYCT